MGEFPGTVVNIRSPFHSQMALFDIANRERTLAVRNPMMCKENRARLFDDHVSSILSDADACRASVREERASRRADKACERESLQRERDAWAEIVRNCRPCHAKTSEGQKSLCARPGCEGSRHYAVACPVMKAARRQRDAGRDSFRGEKKDGASDSTDAPSDASTVQVTKLSNTGLTDRKLAAHQSALQKLTPEQVVGIKKLKPKKLKENCVRLASWKRWALISWTRSSWRRFQPESSWSPLW